MVESIWRKGKLFGFMLLAGILLMAKPALADSYYPYEIQGYDVTVKVGKDNVYHVTERLQVNFNQARHGIYRDIPVINNVSREDGSTSRIQARVTILCWHLLFGRSLVQRRSLVRSSAL